MTRLLHFPVLAATLVRILAAYWLPFLAGVRGRSLILCGIFSNKSLPLTCTINNISNYFVQITRTTQLTSGVGLASGEECTCGSDVPRAGAMEIDRGVHFPRFPTNQITGAVNVRIRHAHAQIWYIRPVNTGETEASSCRRLQLRVWTIW